MEGWDRGDKQYNAMEKSLVAAERQKNPGNTEGVENRIARKAISFS